MEQLTIPNFESLKPQGRFTFSLYYYDENASVYQSGNPHRWRRGRDTYQLCILFSPPIGSEPNDLAYLNKIMSIPFIPNIVDPKGPIWFHQLRDHVVVSNKLKILVPLQRGAPGAGIGLLERKENHWVKKMWSYFDLYKYCFNIDKVASNCADCVEDSEGCVRYTASSMAFERGDPEPNFPESSESVIAIEDLETEDIHPFLKRMSLGTLWEYVRPKETVSNPFVPSLLYVDDIDFSEVDDNREKRKERSLSAANTRRAVARCKKECFYEPYCRWCVKPFYGRPGICQEGYSYGSLPAPGPYKKEQFKRAYTQFWESLPHIDRKKVELIMCNAGLSTWIFGYEAVLNKMNPTMDGVEFIRLTTDEVRTVDFEEAYELFTTPYRWGKEYVYPSEVDFGEKRYWSDSPPVEDELFHTYVEICQHDCTLEGGWGYSNSYPTIQKVRNPGGRILFGTNKEWSYGSASSVEGFIQSYATTDFPKTAQWIKPQE